VNGPLLGQVRLAWRRFLAEPAPRVDVQRSVSDHVRDAWILHGPRWH
jgi:hypothetical protein